MGRRRRISAILLLAATSLMAQSFEKLLPKGAVVIESADVSGIAQKPRVLVLWMLNPQKRNGGPEYCGTVVDGDYDESVRKAHEWGENIPGGMLIEGTAFEGYRDVPRVRFRVIVTFYF